MISIEIEEGFVVSFFAATTPVEWDTKHFYKSAAELAKGLEEYFEKVRKWRLEH